MIDVFSKTLPTIDHFPGYFMGAAIAQGRHAALPVHKDTTRKMLFYFVFCGDVRHFIDVIW